MSTEMVNVQMKETQKAYLVHTVKERFLNNQEFTETK